MATAVSCLQFAGHQQMYLRQAVCSIAEALCTGVEVRVTPMRTEVIIRATRTQNVLGAALQHMYARVSVWRGLEVAA